MSNPCEKCLVQPMCADDCQDLVNFITHKMNEFKIPDTLLKTLMKGNLKNQSITFGYRNKEQGITVTMKDGLITRVEKEGGKK